MIDSRDGVEERQAWRSRRTIRFRRRDPRPVSGRRRVPDRVGSDLEKKLFWVFDDLHCPHPLSPMFEEIGGWWLSCDHMFRRFGTPFAADWITKNVNGYLYTAAIPAEPGWMSMRGVRRPIRRPRAARPGVRRRSASTSTRRCRLWRALRRLVARPARARDAAQLRLPRARARPPGRAVASRARRAAEDAIDIHDRHWKIHWMLNFAQLSATLDLRAVMEKTHGKVDEALLGRLQNSANDRNWDSIEALWEMKEEAKADSDLSQGVRAETAAEIIAALEAIGSRPALHRRAHRAVPERVRLARGLEPRVHLPDRSSTWSRSSSSCAATSRPTTTTPRRWARCAPTSTPPRARSWPGCPATRRRDARGERHNLRMAPLTPDHHFYIDQGANAHVRLVLIAIGQGSSTWACSTTPTTSSS